MLSRRNLIVLSGAAVLAGGAAFYAAQGESFDGKALSVEDAFESASKGDVTLIDIRRPEEWEETGIGVPAHPLDMRQKEFVSALDAILKGDRDKPVALICARGVRSAWLSNRLSEAGYTNVIDVPEGMLGSKAGPGWLARGLPVRKQ